MVRKLPLPTLTVPVVSVVSSPSTLLSLVLWEATFGSTTLASHLQLLLLTATLLMATTMTTATAIGLEANQDG
jgi:hypothetical protein